MCSHANPLNWVLIWIIFIESYIHRLYATPINIIKLFHLDFSKSIANIPAFLVVRYIIFFFFLLLRVPQKGPKGWKDKYNLNVKIWYNCPVDSTGVGAWSSQCSILQSRRGQVSHSEFWYHTSRWQKVIKKFTFERHNKADRWEGLILDIQ